MPHLKDCDVNGLECLNCVLDDCAEQNLDFFDPQCSSESELDCTK